ncbi:MAG: DUF4116 domain-containing protein [Candidatus Margulisiibacteriota bacterium]
MKKIINITSKVKTGGPASINACQRPLEQVADRHQAKVCPAPGRQGFFSILTDLAVSIYQKLRKAYYYELIKKDPWQYAGAPIDIQAEKDIALAAVEQNWQAYSAMPDNLKTDDEIIDMLTRHVEACVTRKSVIMHLELFRNKAVMLASARKGIPIMAYHNFMEDLRYDQDIAEAAITNNKSEYQHLPEIYRDRLAYAKIAIRGYGQNLQHASPSLQENEELVLLAVRNDPKVIIHAAPRLRQSDSFMQKVQIISGEEYQEKERTSCSEK